MLVNSAMAMEIGSKAPDFSLPNYQNSATNGEIFQLSDEKSQKATVIMFICNHCPYVLHIKEELCEIISDYQTQGVLFIAINSNSIHSHPQDGPEFMMEQGFNCPYLYDSTQDVAKSYKAECTPDFYVFDEKNCCYYRGRFDSATPGNGNNVTGSDLSKALDCLVNDELDVYPDEQVPSMGCNIKWL